LPESKNFALQIGGKIVPHGLKATGSI